MPTQNENLQVVKKIVQEAKIALLTNISENGHLVAHPMANQQVDFDSDLWFFSEEDQKVKEIERNPQVNVSYDADKSYVSIRGTARIIRDNQKKKELWNPDVKAWFQKEYDDPSLVLIKVDAQAAEYWQSAGPIAAALEFVKSAAVGKQAKPGSNETVEIQ